MNSLIILLIISIVKNSYCEFDVKPLPSSRQYQLNGGYNEGPSIAVIPVNIAKQLPIKQFEKVQYDVNGLVNTLVTRSNIETIVNKFKESLNIKPIIEKLLRISLGDIFNAIYKTFLKKKHELLNINLDKPTTESVVVIVKPVEHQEHDNVHSSDHEEVDYRSPINDPSLKEEPITDDYIYDQPIEDESFQNRAFSDNTAVNSTENRSHNKNNNNNNNLSIASWLLTTLFKQTK